MESLICAQIHVSSFSKLPPISFAHSLFPAEDSCAGLSVSFFIDPQTFDELKNVSCFSLLLELKKYK